jgi:D-tyrosyl-tRNA(Tyr) deacylase
VFVGVASEDGPADAECIADKLQDLRIFPDADSKMNHSIADTGGSILVVSQFTLQGDCRRGRRASFDSAAPAAHAPSTRPWFVGCAKSELEVFTGVFQADKDVELVNDGPVTPRWTAGTGSAESERRRIA